MRQLRAPLVILVATVCLDGFAFLGLLPSSGEIFAWLSEVVASLGPWWIAFFSAIEHLVVVNVYFPAAIVILVAMGNTYGDLSQAAVVYCAIVAGQLVGYSASYLVGRSLKTVTNAEGGKAVQLLFFSFFHPHSGAISCYLLGTRGFSKRKFFPFLLVSVAFWSLFWAIIAYNGMVSVVTEVGWDTIFYTYLAIWIAVTCYQFFGSGRRR